jgi:hypothetical protein
MYRDKAKRKRSMAVKSSEPSEQEIPKPVTASELDSTASEVL